MKYSIFSSVAFLLILCFSQSIKASDRKDLSSSDNFPIEGCTDPLAANYDPASDSDDGSCLYNIVFNVDMNCELNFSTPSVEGPFFGWCAGCVPLTDTDGDGIYSVTVQLPLGLFEYKYAVDNFASQEDLLDDMLNGGTCAPITNLSTYANREILITPGLILNDTYATCGICDPTILNGCTNLLANNYNVEATVDDGSCVYDVTFNVDLNCYDGDDPNIDIGIPGGFTTIALESPYYGWCGSCVEMSDLDSDGIWSVTLELPEGSFEYKFAHDTWSGHEQLLDDMLNGGTCAPLTDFVGVASREILIPTELTTNDIYGSCGTCPPIPGCTDPMACNYNSNANQDNNSCIYSSGCDTCSGETDGTGTVIDNSEEGEACDDGIVETVNDVIQSDCSCAGSSEDILKLIITALIEGPLDTTTFIMDDALRSAGHIPLTEPYTALGYTHFGGGGETTTQAVMDVSGPNAIVDWIFIELRDVLNPTTVLYSTSALMLKNGSIKAVDGTSNVIIPTPAVDEALIMLRHRNHLNVGSAQPFSTASTIVVDFTASTLLLYGNSDMKTVNGKNVLISGDPNGDGSINIVDKNGHWRSENGGIYNYLNTKSDFNLDGAVNSVDNVLYWSPNNGFSSTVD